MDWKNGESEIVVMKLARLPLSAFVGVVPTEGFAFGFAFSPCQLLLADKCR